MYIVVTGLTLHSRWQTPLFWWFTLPAFHQAKSAPGCRISQSYQWGGTHHTLTAWDTPEAARRYMTTGAHKRAMGSYRRLGTGRVARWESADIPTWPTALELWRTTAVAV